MKLVKDVVYHCESERLAKRFLEQAKSEGFRNPNQISSNSRLSDSAGICFRTTPNNRIAFGNIGFYKHSELFSNLQIIEYRDLVLSEVMDELKEFNKLCTKELLEKIIKNLDALRGTGTIEEDKAILKLINKYDSINNK